MDFACHKRFLCRYLFHNASALLCHPVSYSKQYIIICISSYYHSVKHPFQEHFTIFMLKIELRYIIITLRCYYHLGIFTPYKRLASIQYKTVRQVNIVIYERDDIYTTQPTVFSCIYYLFHMEDFGNPIL